MVSSTKSDKPHRKWLTSSSHVSMIVYYFAIGLIYFGNTVIGQLLDSEGNCRCFFMQSISLGDLWFNDSEGTPATVSLPIVLTKEGEMLEANVDAKAYAPVPKSASTKVRSAAYLQKTGQHCTYTVCCEERCSCIQTSGQRPRERFQARPSNRQRTQPDGEVSPFLVLVFQTDRLRFAAFL